MIKKNYPQQKYIVLFLLCITSLSATFVQALPAKEKGKATNKEIKAEPSNLVRFKARSDHEFLLSADYYYLGKKANQKKSPGVIILHDCRSERDRYTDLAKAVAEQGMHVLSLDFRGYGQSTSMGFSQEQIKKQAKNIVSYQNDIALMMSYWAEDVSSAYKYLRTKVDNSQGIAVVASGCAASYAVSLAEKIHVKAMVLLTPQMTYGDKERYKNLIDIPTYFISSSHHLSSYNTAQELFVWNGSPYSKVQTFKGERRDRWLIKAKLNLVSDITQWLELNLR